MFHIELPCDRGAADLFAPIAGDEGAVLLDSVRSGEAARWSVLADRPARWLTVRGGEDGAGALRRELANGGAHPELAHLPFAGGLIGYLAYDAAHWFEDLPRRARDDLGIPEACFGVYDTFACLDLDARRLQVVSLESRERGEELAARLAAPAPAGGSVRCGHLTAPDPAVFQGAVARARAYIGAGDVFQVNLAQRLSVPVDGDLFALYRTLAALNPAPFASFLRFPGITQIGASPERLVLVDARRRIETRPIAGTHPRLPDPAADAAMVERLSRDPKERAEHVMMVDLERNDLGRVCAFGTVRVSDMLRVESYSHVHHLVSTVEGVLRADAGPVDVLRAVFPGGTITGAPKVRAMQIIDELEPVRRGAYTGSVGMIGRDGRMDLNIVIRTLQVVRGVAHLYAGAGIVWESQPEREHRETMHKARALLVALGLDGGAP